MRKTIRAFGEKRRHGYVRVLRDERLGKILVQWSEHGSPMQQGFADTRNGIEEAKAYASGTHERLTTTPVSATAPITVRDLYTLYVTAKMDAWRPATLVNKKSRWRKFELFVGRDTLAHLVTREDLDALKRTLLAQGQAPNQVKHILGTVVTVYRWGVERDRLAPTKVAAYRAEFRRDQGPLEMAEYRADERAKLIAAFDPRDSRQWRPYVLTVLFSYLGTRQTAARQLQWIDVDLTQTAGRVHWLGATDKMANDRWQPLPAPVVEALWVAYGWRAAQGYAGPFVFYAPKAVRRRDRGTAEDGVYTYQAYNQALHAAEDRAGIPRRRFLSAHGFRRGIAGDIHERTGSSKDAADWIGDKSPRIVERHYLKKRDDRMDELAVLSTRAGATGTPPEHTTKGEESTDA